MTAEEIKKFAADACKLINKQQRLLNKKANIFNADLLKKASEAVYTMYGCPATCKPEQIAEFWKERPESLLHTIQKMASERTQQVAVSGTKLGKTISKKASESDNKLSADEAFYANYK